MSRTVIGMCMAAAFGVATLAAQSTATSTAQTTMSKSDNITVSGCLQKDARGGFVLNNAQIDTSTDKSSSSYGSSSTTGTTGSATTSTTASASASTWNLEGSSSDLEEHIGHKIQVTGKEKPAAPPETGATTTGTTGTTGTSTAMDHSRSLDVKSVKMVASSCS
jgi:hypothetical protein